MFAECQVLYSALYIFSKCCEGDIVCILQMIKKQAYGSKYLIFLVELIYPQVGFILGPMLFPLKHVASDNRVSLVFKIPPISYYIVPSYHFKRVRGAMLFA